MVDRFSEAWTAMLFKGIKYTPTVGFFRTTMKSIHLRDCLHNLSDSLILGCSREQPV